MNTSLWLVLFYLSNYSFILLFSKKKFITHPEPYKKLSRVLKRMESQLLRIVEILEQHYSARRGSECMLGMFSLNSMVSTGKVYKIT